MLRTNGRMAHFIHLFFLTFTQTVWTLSFTEENVTYNYVIHFENKCRSEVGRFNYLPRVSLVGCIKECGLRKHCAALNYRRRAKLCELFSAEEAAYDVKTGDCIIVHASEINVLENPCATKDCTDGESCDLESKTCVYKDCAKKIVLDNGEVQGNMRDVGSRIKYTCTDGFEEKNGREDAVCEQTGNFSVSAACKVKGCGAPPPIPNGKSNLDKLDGTLYLDTATVTCDSWFESTATKITCTSMGNWTHAECDHVKCYDGTPWDYMGKINYTADGEDCLRWDTVESHWVDKAYFPDETLEDAGNYCRNPDPDSYPPWCLLTADGQGYGYCDITKCSN